MVTRRPQALVAPAVVALAVGVLLVLAVWASAAGHDPVLQGTGPAGVERTDVPTPQVASEARRGESRPRTAGNELPVVHDTWFGWVVLAGLAAGLLFVAQRLLRRLWQAFRDRAPAEGLDPDEVDFEVLSPDEVTRRLAEGTEVQQRLLAEGSPRNAIVRCWSEVERVAAACGLAREPWETPAEYTLRFFDLAGADATAVQRLAALYREARFSGHEIAEADRAAAGEALAEIRRSLRRPRALTGVPPGGPP